MASNGGSWLTFNGTFNPGLSEFTPGIGWRHGSLPGLSSVNNMSYGGLATIDRWAFLPDMETGGSGSAKGIVRFELDSLTGTRFFTDDEYTDLNIGLDGLLYALRGDYGPIDVIEPKSMIRVRSFFPGGGGTSSIPTLRGVAADIDGNVFVVSWDEAVYKLAPNGTILLSRDLPGPGGGEFFADTHDINISLDGTRLAVGSRFGWFVQMFSDLNNVTYHRAGVGDVQVAFDEPPPTLPEVPFIRVNDPEAVEGDGASSTMTFTVTLSEPANRPVSVRYTAMAGTATEGTDFAATTDTLTFNTGQTSKTVTVPLIGDLADEPDETVFLILSNPLHGVIVDMQGQGLILDDDGTPVANVADAVPVDEGNTGTVPVTFKVKLSKVPKTPVTVNYATQDGTAIAGEDYDALTGTLTFEAGQNTKTVTVNVRPDRVAEDRMKRSRWYCPIRRAGPSLGSPRRSGGSTTTTSPRWPTPARTM